MTEQSTLSQEVILTRVGARVRARRHARGLTVKALAARAHLSPRFISQLESGRGNIAIGRLHQVASALDVALYELVEGVDHDLRGAIHQVLGSLGDEELRRALAALEVLFGESSAKAVTALLGLRGAGKSSVGQALADALGVPFVELDERIEAEACLTLEEIFALHGEPYYRRLEARCLLTLLSERQPAVVALSGGVVRNEEAFEMARRRCATVWLKATPQEHMERVQAQGDHRPMANRGDAMAELRAILKAREPFYQLAEHAVDTSGRSVHDVVLEIVRLI